jgi:hypothetical protein
MKQENCYGERSGSISKVSKPTPIFPLSRWADLQVDLFVSAAGLSAVKKPTGAGLMAERARSNRFRVPGIASAGGHCHFLRAREDWVALNLARPGDRELLPALFCDESLNPDDDASVRQRMQSASAIEIVSLGRELGMAIARLHETPVSPAMETIVAGLRRDRRGPSPLVIDLSALWAGPLATHLLWLAGAQVVKIENPKRPDAMRQGDPELFGLLNQGKYNIALDPSAPADRARFIELIRRADIVIESSRPRALVQFGIDPNQLVREKAGLTWISITAHGGTGAASDWIGFGDDCGVAGGLSSALFRASGKIGFVGDAIADPLTGIIAALQAWEGWTSGQSRRTVLSMSAISAMALQQEADCFSAKESFSAWANAEGQLIACGPKRRIFAPVRPLGADNNFGLPDSLSC